MMKVMLLGVSAAALLATNALADGRRVYAEAYPYYKTAEKMGVRGYTPYPMHGCSDYELKSNGAIRHICNRRSAGEIFKTMDREGQGTADSE